MKIRNINTFCRPAGRLFLAMLILGCAPATRARAEGFRARCGGLFARIKPTLIQADNEKYLALRKASVHDYFPDSETLAPLPGTVVKGAKITEENLKRFRADFDELLDQRALIFHFPADKFRAWLRTTTRSGKPYPDLDPVMIEQAFKENGATLEDLQNAYFLAFANATKKGKLSSFIKKLHPSEIGRLGLTVAGKLSAETKSIMKGAIVAGPIAGILNAFISALIKPVAESSEQVSNILFSDWAQVIQKHLADKVKSLQPEMSALATTTDALDQYDFEGMDRKRAKAVMDDFEDRYYKIFLRMSGFMPPFKRGGRDIIRDWLINQPLMMANHATTFNMEFTMNQVFLSNLQEKIKARGGKPTPEEEQLIEQYKENMESAENRLAVTLASWRIFTFTFAEVAREPHLKDANTTLMNTLGRYEKFMNMDKYRRELTGKVREAFHDFDPSFTGLDHLDPNQRKESPK